MTNSKQQQLTHIDGSGNTGLCTRALYGAIRSAAEGSFHLISHSTAVSSSHLQSVRCTHLLGRFETTLINIYKEKWGGMSKEFQLNTENC